MNTRSHHEAQIKRFDSTFGGELEDAITTLAFRIGLAWFTDDQIADIRETMMLNELRRRKNNAANRKAYAERRQA